MNRGVTILILFFCLLSSCQDSFEYSPNQVFDSDSEINLNQKNLELLTSTPGDDTITVAFMGDTQRFYDELEEFIDTVNQIQQLDFLLLAGDISDFGLLEEFEQVHDRLKKLNKPYFGIIGNHDVLAKGEETFERMYGPLNFSFTYNGVKFILHNTNSREYNSGNVPDMNWLSQQFNDDASVKHYIPVSHIPPFDADFDKSLENQYATLFRKKNVLLSLHGHIHQYRDGYPYADNIRYITSASFQSRSFVLLQIVSGKVYDTVIEY